MMLENQEFDIESILEGGAYGHLSHPFEDFDLTMADLHKMIQDTVNGAFGPENFVQEKCVSGDTLVELEKLGTITIKELVENRYEDNILSQDSLGESVYLPIMDWVNNGPTDEWLEIETEDGQILKVTPNHRIFANGVDIKAEELQVGDSLSAVNKESKIKSIRKIKSEECRYDLTVANTAHYFANGILVHNTDGQNIMISWKNGKLIAARNKGHLKNAGENAMDIAGVAQMFAGRGDIETAYNAAMEDLSAAIGSLSEADKKKLFDEGKKFASVEVITPITQNTVPYGLNMLVFHGVLEYDENANVIDEDKQAGRDLGKLIADVNQSAQKTFFVRGPQDMDIKPFPNTAKRSAYYEKKFKEIIQSCSLTDASTVYDYAIGMAKNILIDEASKAKITIPPTALDGLAARIAGINKAYSNAMIKKELGPSAEWYIELEKKQAKPLKRKVFAPLENLFIEVGTEFMKNMTSFLSANPTESAESMRKEIEKVISTIKVNGGPDEIEKLEHELGRISAAGGLDSIVPTEGITFVFKGKLYKYTGIFSPLHQIRSMLAYKK